MINIVDNTIVTYLHILAFRKNQTELKSFLFCVVVVSLYVHIMTKSNKLIWKDEYILFIIERVKIAEFIWNHNHMSYKNKGKKNLFWTNVVDELNANFEIAGVFTYGDVVKKWQNTKTYFTSEYHKHYKSVKSGAGTNEVYNSEESKWKFYENLMFLKETCEIMPSVNNYNKRSLKELSRDSATHMGNTNNSLTEDTNCSEMEILDSDDSTVLSYFTSIHSPMSPSNIDLNQSPTSNYKRPRSPNIDLHDTSATCHSNSSSRFITSTPILSESETRILRPTPLHPTKKARLSSKSKHNELTEACLQSSKEIQNHLQIESKPKLKYQSYGEWIAQDLERLDKDLLNLAKHKINNVLFEIMEVQNQRDDEKQNQKQ